MSGGGWWHRGSKLLGGFCKALGFPTLRHRGSATCQCQGCWGHWGPGTRVRVLGVTVARPGQRGMMLERAGQLVGSWFCYLIKIRRKLGIFHARLSGLGRGGHGNQRVGPTPRQHRAGTHVSVGVLQPPAQC